MRNSAVEWVSYKDLAGGSNPSACTICWNARLVVSSCLINSRTERRGSIPHSSTVPKPVVGIFSRKEDTGVRFPVSAPMAEQYRCGTVFDTHALSEGRYRVF